MQSKNPRKFFSLTILGFLSLTILLNFQNCGKARLYKMGESNSSITAQNVSILPPPVSKDVELRVVIVVDQSNSMKYAKCPEDLDGPSPKARPAPCTPGNGVDPDYDRYKIIESWLASLEIAAGGTDTSSTVKVAVLPFSGGIKQRPVDDGSTPKDSDMMADFKNIAETKNWVAKLKKEHIDEPPLSLSKKMGTSVPLPVLEIAKGLLDKEFQKLSNTNKLEKAQFKFIYISDGVFKPIESLFRLALDLAQCPTDCQTICRTNQDPSVCTDARPTCVPDSGYTGGPSPYDYCNIQIPQRFKYAYGEFSQNTLGNIASAITAITKLPETYNGGDLKVHLTKLYPSRVPNEDKPSPIPNIFDKIIENFTNNSAVTSAVIETSTPPFSVQPRNMGLVTYKISKFFVVNLNAFVNEYGEYVADSDGDGLSDIEENQLGYSPIKARSQKSGSKCLDSIDKLFGCEKQRPCDMTLDADADGLSQCDEVTMKSNPEFSDSDEDDLFDLLETFRPGLSPNANETKGFKSGDKFNDHQHFFAGVHPQIKLDNVEATKQISTEVKFVNLERTQTLGGSIKISSMYSIKMNNIPLMNTLAVPAVSPMKYTKKVGGQLVTRPIPSTDDLGPTAHAAGINQIDFYVKVVAIENAEDFYWLHLRKDIHVNQNMTNFKINLLDFQELNLLK